MDENQVSDRPPVDTLRISANEWDTVLSRLEQEKRSQFSDEKRSEERFLYRNILGLIMEIPESTGDIANYLVKSRNLSRTGLSLLHGQAIPIGTHCMVTLVKSNYSQDRCHGNVIRCRQIEGCVHEIGLQFDRPIDLSAYLRPLNQVQLR